MQAHPAPRPGTRSGASTFPLAGLLLLGSWLLLGWLPCAAAAERLAVAVSRSPRSLPLYVAQEQGFFAAEQLDVTLSDCVGGHRCMRLLLDGKADVATASEMPLVVNSFERSDYAVIGTFATAKDDVRLIVKGHGGSDPSMLKGKRIGAVPGSDSQYFLDLYLLTVGIDPRELSVVRLQPEEMIDALQAGKVDAIAIWEPFAYEALKALGAGAVALPSASSYLSTFNLIAQRKMLGPRDAAMTRLLRAVERAEQFIQQHPDDAKAILRQRLQLDQALVDWVWPSLGFRLGLDQALLATMESRARWAQREGHVKGRHTLNFLTLVYTPPLDAFKPTAVGTLH